MLRMARPIKNTTTAIAGSHRMRRNALILTVAAALSTTSRVDAFLAPPPLQQQQHLSFTNNRVGYLKPVTAPLSTPNRNRHAIRLYSSKKDESILKRAAKKILPKKWFQSKEDQAIELKKQEVKDKVKGSIKEMLKDAPLPVRMMGSMVAPLLSRAASQMSESLQEQEQMMETILDDTKSYLLGDEVAMQALGEPFQVGAPFQQSSSTSIINGQRISNIVLGFPVEGSRSSGVVQAQATQQGIQRLTLEVNGQQINVSLTKRSISPSSGGRVGKNHRSMSSNMDDDNIIEAEIIEKTQK